MSKPRILVLAGTHEARHLIAKLSKFSEFEVIASLAGRTKKPETLEVPTRIGGFGGTLKMAAYLKSNRIDLVVDATHPYAAQITSNAIEACQKSNSMLLRLERPEWLPTTGDHWHSVSDLNHALSIVPKNMTVFFAASIKLTAPLETRNDLSFIIRSLEPVPQSKQLNNATYVNGLPSSQWQEEAEILQHYKVDWVISKNSGGSRSYAKIQAARELNIPVAMLERPKPLVPLQVESEQEALSYVLQYFNTLAT